MKVTYVGHACYSVVCGDRHVLVDPVLTSTFQDGTSEVWPRRRVDVAAMPRPDAVIVTHAHPGHLEVPSLALLPRDVTVFYPADPTIELVLAELGFDARVELAAGDHVEFDGGRLTVTASTSGYPELGCLFVEGAASCWYLADTSVSREWVQRVLAQVPGGRIGLLLGNYPGYHHKFFTHLDTTFPDAELQRTLDTTLAIRPTLLAVNFTGLRYIGDSAWINRFMFPMDAAGFLAEVAALAPEQRGVDLRPGDEVWLADDDVALVREQASPWIRAVESADVNPDELRFDPAFELPRLRDPDPERLGRALLASRISALLGDELRAWIRVERANATSLPARYARNGVKFRVHVVYPEGPEETWHIDAAAADIAVVRGGRGHAHIGLRIAASVLDRWRRAEIPYYRVYAYARPFGTAYRASLLRDGEVAVSPIETRDLIAAYFNRDIAHVYHPWLLREIHRHGGHVR